MLTDLKPYMSTWTAQVRGKSPAEASTPLHRIRATSTAMGKRISESPGDTIERSSIDCAEVRKKKDFRGPQRIGLVRNQGDQSNRGQRHGRGLISISWEDDQCEK